MAVLQIKEDQFEAEVEKAEGKVLVDFWAGWCGPCKMLSPIVEEVAEEAAGFKVASCNVDDEISIARKYGVMSIPTLVVIKDGKETNRSVGAISREEVLALVGA